jgi:LPPG:FO 2-phospho-L-lactate transferase
MIAVLCGGVGGARFLSGLVQVVPPQDIVAVVNTGDDVVLHGLHVSPDLDTITYTLAGAIDPERGWGLAGETWRVMEALGRFVPVRPDGSMAATTWFNLGDRDLATHLYRAARLAEGASLSTVTAEITAAFGLGLHVRPMTEQRVETRVTVQDPGAAEPVEVSFQEYFVLRRHAVPVTSVRFAGAADATPTFLDDLRDAEAVVIAPSNPLVSVGPLRALDGVDAALAARRDAVVAVSPIVGGAALKGPADRMMTELGHEATVVGVARLYAPICGTLVIDPVDEHLCGEVEATGMRCVVTPTVMRDPQTAAALATTVLGAVR